MPSRDGTSKSPKPKSLAAAKPKARAEKRVTAAATAPKAAPAKAPSAAAAKKETDPKKLPGYVIKDLYPVYAFLSPETRQRVGLMLKIPVFIKDPWVARENPAAGVQAISVRLEPGMGDGPTSSRIAVVDYNANSQLLTEPIHWDAKEGWFFTPSNEPLPAPPTKRKKSKPAQDGQAAQLSYTDFVTAMVKNQFFHQLNVWAVVQRVLEFYEEPWSLGRPVPWGFDGNRLLVVPHAGYGENAFYDQGSKSLQFYYFGDPEDANFTCLSFDVISHETGHAVLDGIRPLYNEGTASSVQGRAFHEFIGDLTAIMLALFNKDIRDLVSETTKGMLDNATLLSHLAPEFGNVAKGRPYLRSAANQNKMSDVEGSLSPHAVSEVLTGAMFELLTRIADENRAQNFTPGQAAEPAGAPDDDATEETGIQQKQADSGPTPAQFLYKTCRDFRRVALQALDLCPPCDIQFVDYTRAVLCNDTLTNPVDEHGYRQIMLDVFHEREFCKCTYKSGEPLPFDCEYLETTKPEKQDYIFHDIERVARSRTAAYYFLSDNRRPLRIPAHQDVRVADLYDNSKYGIDGERLPREIVLEYLWQEQMVLKPDPQKNLDFGAWNDKTVYLDCGGTLLFDGRGNLLSWFRKPGTEHLSDEEAAKIQKADAAYRAALKNGKRSKKDKPTKQKLGELADWKIGRERKAALLHYYGALVRNSLVGAPASENRFGDGDKPVVAIETDGIVQFRSAAHMHLSEMEAEEGTWRVIY